MKGTIHILFTASLEASSSSYPYPPSSLHQAFAAFVLDNQLPTIPGTNDCGEKPPRMRLALLGEQVAQPCPTHL